MKRIISLFLLLALALTSAAYAEYTGEEFDWYDATLNKNNNILIIKTAYKAPYQLYNIETGEYTGGWDDVTVRGNLFEIEVSNGSANNHGAVDMNGLVLVPAGYIHLDFASDRWIIASHAVDATVDNYDYYSTDYSTGTKYYFIVDYNDVYFNGNKVGTLGRTDVQYSYAYGDYLLIRGADGTYTGYDKNFVKSPYQPSYSGEYDSVYSNGKYTYYHVGSGQKAFCPECTLTRDEVSQWLMDDGKCNYYDLQGNLVITGAANFTYSNRFSGDYARVKTNVGYGLIDTTGKLVVPCEYSDIDYYSDHLFATGYVAVYRDGKLGFCDLNGVETYSDFKYASNVVSVTGAFGRVKDLDGSYIIITAAAGELAERFKDYSYFNDQSRLVVLQKNDGSVGVIGLAGEEVIPFSADYRYTSNISVSNDESTILVYDRSKGSGVYVVYTGSYDFEPPVAEEEIVLQPGEWICPACGGVRNTNFCMEDGTMKPATDWFCPGCGTQNISDFNFCPYCGTKRP